ncbi:MAG: subclass B3 metallo-beta-lactamase [Sphingomonas sp.]|nr:subclass B3 metallo-beta-lactamase [Sphingomonas sp.]
MFARIALILLLAATAACQSLPGRTAAAPRASALVTQCAGKEGWSDPAPPARIFGNTYYVGTCGITALLITSRQGHVLIDGATAQAAPSIAANIERLGFKPSDIKLLLNSHEHFDHAGGIAILQRATGAQLLVREPSRLVFQTGRPAAADPQAGSLDPLQPARVDRILAAGEIVRLGPLALTAHATPGHSPGGTSWTWRSCERRRCLRMAFADSISAVSAETYRFTDHPAHVAHFRATLAKVAGLECDLLMTPHPSASKLFDRLAGKGLLINPGACKGYSELAAQALDERLGRERPR